MFETCKMRREVLEGNISNESEIVYALILYESDQYRVVCEIQCSYVNVVDKTDEIYTEIQIYIQVIQ